MVGIWQEREMANGNSSVTIDSIPEASVLRELYASVRAAEKNEIKLSKTELGELLIDKKLPELLTSLGERLGVKVSVDKRSNTITLKGSGATQEEFRLFRALATDLVYAGNKTAEKAFGMSPRERLAAIIDWESHNKNGVSRNADIMNYELQLAKRYLRDEHGLTTDPVMERLRRRAAESFTSRERLEHISEITDWFDRILTERHQARLQEMADRRDALNKAIQEKDSSLYLGSEPVRETQDAQQRLLSTKLEDLGLSVRTYKFVKDKGFETIGDIVRYNRTPFVKQYGPSTAVLKEIVGLVDNLRLKFGTDVSASQGPSWDIIQEQYLRELGEIQNKLGAYTRMQALKEISPEAIFDEIRKKFEDLKALSGNDAEFIKALGTAFKVPAGFVKKNLSWYKDQVSKVLDNYLVLCEEACKELETSELIHVTISLDDTYDVSKGRMDKDEDHDGEEENDVNGIENQYKENWMYEFDTSSNWSKMSARVRHMLYRCPLGKRNTRFGTAYRMPIMQTVNTLLQEMQGVMNSRDMDAVLESMEGNYPWVKYIREQIAQDSQLKTELFRTTRRYAQSIGVLRKSDVGADAENYSKSELKIINSGMTVNSIYSGVQNQLSSGVPINKKLSLYKDEGINTAAIDRIRELLEPFKTPTWNSEERTWNKDGIWDIANAQPETIPALLKEYPDLIPALHKAMTALGFAVTESDIRLIAVREPQRNNNAKNNIAVFITTIKQLLDQIEKNDYRTIDDLLNERKDVPSRAVMPHYRKLSELLTLNDNGSVEASVRENGKTRYSYVLPSVLDDLITGLQGKHFSHIGSRGQRVNKSTSDYILEKYGNDPRFAVNNGSNVSYRNYILESIVNGGTYFTPNYVTLLNASTSDNERVEQKDLTQMDRLNIMWSMYHMSDTKFENARGTWYPIPLPSDSGRMGFISLMPTAGVEERKQVIKEAIIKELERMTATNSDAHLPETFRKNKGQFCTFPILNDEKVTGYSVADIIAEFNRSYNTSQHKELDEMLDDFVDDVRTAMVEKFIEENTEFYNARVKERGEEYVDAVIEDMSIMQMALNELINGDPAYYTGYNTGSDNIQKRAKQSIVPLDHMDIFNPDFLEAYKAYHGIDTPDEELTEDDIVEHAMYIQDPKIPSPSYDDLKKLYDNALDDGIIDKEMHDEFLALSESIKYTDGQAIRSFESMRMMMYALGEMKKGDDLDNALGRIAEGKQQPGDSLIIRTALKPFLSGLIPITEPDGSTRLMPVQHKLSEQILTAALIQAKGTMIGDSPALNALARVMKEQHVDAVIFTSGVKVGQNGAVDFGDVDVEEASEDQIVKRIYNSMDEYRKKTGMSIIHKIPYQLWGIVSYNPGAEVDDDGEIPIGTQMQKILSADLPDTIDIRDSDGKIIRSEKAVYTVEGVGDLSRDEVIRLYNELMTEKILRAYREVKGTFANKEELSKALMRACRNSSRNSSYLERAFSLDEYGNFVIPLCDLATLNMSSEFLNSIVKNAVSRITAPGKQLVSMSAFGFAKKLKLEFEYDEHGEPISYKSIDCLLPAWASQIIDRCTNENGMLDFNKLAGESPRLCKMLATRIPTQFKNFILPLRCVGFLPTLLGDTIVTAIDNISLQDSDFDNDKEPTIFPSFTADYYEDGWEDKAFEEYKKYADTFYDFDKLRDDFKEYMAMRHHDGIADNGYSFRDFYHERLDDEDFETQYRRPNAPEGKPIKFWQYSEQHKDEYLRPDGPKLNYIAFDHSLPMSEQTDEQLNNGLIDVMHAMLTSKAVATMSLASGSPERLDPLIDLINKNTPARTFPDGPADIATRISQETRNNDGKQMIAVFANTNAMQAMLQHTHVELQDGMGVKINGRTLTSLHDMNIEDSIEYISRAIGVDLGAAADNAKKPRLSVMNINLRTAPVVSIMLQLGYTMKEIALFLNIPSIRHYTDTNNFDSYTEPEGPYAQELPGNLDDMIHAIRFGDDYDDMDDDLAEYCDTALSVFMYLKSVGERMRKLSSLARGDSGSTAPHGPLENNLIRLLNYELFQEQEAEDPLFKNWRELVDYDYQNEVTHASVMSAANPIAQAYVSYGVVGAFRELSQFYPGIGDPNFRVQIKNIIKKYYDGVATATNVKNIMYSLYNYIESSYDCMRKGDLSVSESRNYYLNYFPEEAAEIISRYPEIGDSLLFKRLKLFSTLESDEDPFISLMYDGTMLPQTRDEFTAVWQQLFYAKNEDGSTNQELRNLALDLFKYCYYRNGFRFASGTFAHLAPAEARIFFPGYVEMLKSMQQGLSSEMYQNFESQFVRNNLYDKRFCQTVPSGVQKPDYRDADGNAKDYVTIKYRSKMDETHQRALEWYFAGDEERDTPRTAFVITQRTSDNSIRYLYYMKIADNDVTGESTYVLTTPLGWKDKAVEYAANEPGVSMPSVFDQEQVAVAVRPKKYRLSRRAAVGQKTNDSVGLAGIDNNSSEAPNEDLDEGDFWGNPGKGSSKKLSKKGKTTTKVSTKKVKSKEQIAREKAGGKKTSSKMKIVPDVKGGTIRSAEAKCAQEIGAYTISITDKDSAQLGMFIHSVTPNDSHWVADLYEPGNAYDIARAMAKKLQRKTIKSIVLNLTGSYMNTIGKYATQEDLDAYVLKIYRALKDVGIYVSKVVSTAQPGIPLASARAAMSLGYNLEVHPTSDYQVFGKQGEKPSANKDAFMANLNAKGSKISDAKVYDKEEGPFITAQGKWTRDIASKDKKTLYVFTDNTDRTSGSNRVPPTSKYAKKYGAMRVKSYPNTTSAVIRGLENAYPISTQKTYSPSNPEAGRWQDSDWKEFRSVISSEVDDIIEAFESGEYKRVVLPVGGVFEGPIAGISQDRTPRLFRILNEQMERLRESIEEISETQVNSEEEDDGGFEMNLKTDKNDILSGDDIQYPNIAGEGDEAGNLHVVNTDDLADRKIILYNEAGEKLNGLKLFIVFPKGNQSALAAHWAKAKLYAQDGTRVMEEVQFSTPSSRTKYNLLTASNGGVSIAALNAVSEEVPIAKGRPLNKSGLLWLDDNNEPICK